MRITKYTHSCVRLEHDEGALVIDPGVWSEPSALAGADAVLVTHGHIDHVDVLRLAGSGVAAVYAPAGADIGDLRVTEVAPGDEFDAAGFRVRAVGARHAAVYGGEPACPHLGYLVGGEVYHPGDSLHVPSHPVRTLLVPVQGSWMKTSEAIDFVTTVRPERAFGIHDAQLNERGLGSVNSWLAEQTGVYRWLAPREKA